MVCRNKGRADAAKEEIVEKSKSQVRCKLWKSFVFYFSVKVGLFLNLRFVCIKHVKLKTLL